MSNSSFKNYSDNLITNEKETYPFSVVSTKENNTEKLRLIENTFEKPFDKNQFSIFVRNLLNTFDERNSIIPVSNPQNSVEKLECIGKYENSDKKIDILIANLKKDSSLERARANQRNCISNYLRDMDKDGALVAFVPPKKEDWRFSFVKIDYRLDNNGKIIKESTPARRCSFLVGKNEASHTAKSMFLSLLKKDNENPKLSDLEKAFSVEKVTTEFYTKYRELFDSLKKSLDKIIKEDKKIKFDFEKNQISSSDFSKKLLGQIIFLYFLQKKGWFGVKKGKKWGTGSKKFIRELFVESEKENKNFFKGILEPLFYNALNKKYKEDYNKQFQCRIPFLNGGLFKPIGKYDWENTNINFPNSLFSNKTKNKEGDIGNGILDIFERYNFTVNENEPLEKEVAIDPEMLGKVFENLLEIKDRKSTGTYYTPRKIVHYMCQESLINYLAEELKDKVEKQNIETLVRQEDLSIKNSNEIVSLNFLKKIQIHAKLIDKKLKDIRVCDPAIGSGAFPVGMMTEIVRIRNALSPMIKNEKERRSYNFKRHAIEHSLYGVDIDSGAIEIAKLRLWLSLVVDDKNGESIKPLPNLNYKIVCGNSLLGNIYHKSMESPVRTQIVSELKTHKNLFITSLPKDNRSLLQKIHKLKKKLWKNDISQKIRTIKEEMSQLEFFSNKKLNEYKLKIEKVQNLKFENDFNWDIDFCEVFQEKKGFDIIIANPPYAKEGDNKSMFKPVIKTKWGKKYHQSKMNYWYFFLHKSIDIVSNNGIISFITSRYWLNSSGARKLIHRIKDKLLFLDFIDIGKLKVFDEVAGQHMIATYAKSTVNKKNFTYKKIENDLSDIYKNKNTRNLKVKILNSESIYSNQDEILVEGNCYFKGTINLGSICDVSQGVVEATDKVSKKAIKNFINIQGIQVGKGIFVLTQKELKSLSLNKIEQSIIEKYIDPSDVFKYGIQYRDKYLIYSNKSMKEQIKNSSNFSNVKHHLEKLQMFITSSNAPYGLHRPRKSKFFKNPKIIFKNMFKEPEFTYDTSGLFFGFSFSSIIEKDEAYNLKYILSILNSKIGYYWYQKNCKKRGAGFDVGVKKIREFPIKKINQKKQKPFIDLVDKILSITKSKDYLRNSFKQKQVAKYEKQIDQLVYKLYNLTPEEIKTIENF